jgi:hypothetical protein
MAKSRKSPASILRLAPLRLAGLLGLFLAAAAIGFVWHRNRNEQLVRDNTQRRRVLETLEKQNQQLEYLLVGLTRPEALAERARALGLDRPEPAQVLRVELLPFAAPAPPGAAAVDLAARRRPRRVGLRAAARLWGRRSVRAVGSLGACRRAGEGAS